MDKYEEHILIQSAIKVRSLLKDYIDDIFKNNPYVYHRFEPGDFDIVFTDHDRAYTNDINIPLTEQILARFGYTQDEIINADCRPNLYFDENENPNPDIKDEYGCLLFASRIDKLKGRWDDKNLIKEARKYKDTPVYYYSEFDLDESTVNKMIMKARENWSSDVQAPAGEINTAKDV